MIGSILASELVRAGRLLTTTCSTESFKAGWHNDPKTGRARTEEENKAFFPVRIALCHSELSEALEGDRKNLTDDHLPHRTMAEVELADAAIRIFDLAGVMGYDLGAAIAEKLAYNAQRPDHKITGRQEAHGKAY